MLFMPFMALTANWYVDNAASGSGDGASWTNAWKTFSDIVWEGPGVKAGDTLYISGGSASKTYTNSWSVGASGTPTRPITIAIDATNPNHNGVVIFDYDHLGDHAGPVIAIACPASYITFNGNVGGSCHFAINNLRDIGDSFATVGIYGDSTAGVIVDSIASTNCNNPIRLQHSTGITVRNCSLQQVRGDAAISLAECFGSILGCEFDFQ